MVGGTQFNEQPTLQILEFQANAAIDKKKATYMYIQSMKSTYVFHRTFIRPSLECIVGVGSTRLSRFVSIV